MLHKQLDSRTDSYSDLLSLINVYVGDCKFDWNAICLKRVPFYSFLMLQEQYQESSGIGSEYQKLLQAWNHTLSNNGSTEFRKNKTYHDEHVQFALMHLFNGYLDQIWTDSQNMLQCARAWTNQSPSELPPDAVHTMHVLGLHLMKQSLRTRQELFRIVDELNETSPCSNDDDSVFSASNSTTSLDTSIDLIRGKNEYTDLEQLGNGHKKNMDDVCSPSTPTINQTHPDTVCYFKDVTPVNRCDQNSLKNEEGMHDRDFFCHEPLSRDSSVVGDFRLLSGNNTDEEEEINSYSSYDIASFYYNSGSDEEEDRMEREYLLDNNVRKFKKSSSTSLKTHFQSNSISSSIIHYDVQTKRIKKNKLRNTRLTLHRQFDTSSSCLPHSTTCSSANNSSIFLGYQDGVVKTETKSQQENRTVKPQSKIKKQVKSFKKKMGNRSFSFRNLFEIKA